MFTPRKGPFSIESVGDDELKQMPNPRLKAQYERLLVSNPARAKKLWDEWARSPRQLAKSYMSQLEARRRASEQALRTIEQLQSLKEPIKRRI